MSDNGDSAPNNKLFVANLTYNTRQRDLEDIFSKYGKVAEVHIAEDRDTGRSKGFAFVTMEDARDAKDALAAAGKVVDDREIKVELAVGKSRGGGGGRYGDGGGGGRFSNPGICYDWKSGRCSRGSSCRFSHEGEDRGGGGGGGRGRDREDSRDYDRDGGRDRDRDRAPRRDDRDRDRDRDYRDRDRGDRGRDKSWDR